jgi:hypothetical protein
MGTDTGTGGDTDEVQLTFGLLSGGGRSSSDHYRCTVSVGTTPSTQIKLQSESYRLRLGIGAQVNP